MKQKRIRRPEKGQLERDQLIIRQLEAQQVPKHRITRLQSLINTSEQSPSREQTRYIEIKQGLQGGLVVMNTLNVKHEIQSRHSLLRIHT